MSPSSSRRESRIILHLHPTYLSFKSIAQRVIWTGSLLFRDFRLRSHANTLHGWINGMQWSVSLAIFNLRVISCDSFHVHFKSHWTLNYYDRTVQIRDPSSNNIFFTMIKNWTYISETFSTNRYWSSSKCEKFSGGIQRLWNAALASLYRIVNQRRIHRKIYQFRSVVTRNWIGSRRYSALENEMIRNE